MRELRRPGRRWTLPGIRWRYLGTRWLGVGLGACLAVVTLALAFTDRLSLYINPDTAWFAVSMAVVLVLGAVASFALPLGAEEDHGHEHGAAEPEQAHAHAHTVPHARRDRPGALRPAAVFRVTGGVLATGVVGTMLLTPAASLSAELAISRDVGAAPLFAGADVVTLASSGDTAQFGVGEWASAFASATNPGAFEGDAVNLTGFVTPGGEEGFALTRLVITHCVIDAQPASVPVAASSSIPATGQWVAVRGHVRSTSDGSLQVYADEVTLIDEPRDPYEY